jgi:hypothetical protein
MVRKGLASSLSGVYDLVQFPWERLILLSCLILGSWWLYGKVAKCQAEVNLVVNEAKYIINSSPCNEKREKFKNAIKCEEFSRKLEPEYQEEIWWTCFLNTFIFYRSWVGLAIFGLTIYGIVSVCRVPKYKAPKKVVRYPRIPYRPEPQRLEYRPQRRMSGSSDSRSESSESSEDSL